MANTVKVVTAYVDLGLAQRPSSSFHALGDRLVAACPNIKVFRNFPYDKCWLVEEGFDRLPPANPRALDRFDTEDEHRRSNVIQHSPVQWVQLAAEEDHKADVFVWIGYSVFKQGDFTGKPVRECDVAEFLDRVAHYPFFDIPFPGIGPMVQVHPFGDNWRFCGSVVIFPRRFIPYMVNTYKFETRSFLRKHCAIPLDLAIWPAVEHWSWLPFRFYQAEYDRTQFTNFPSR